MQKGIRRTILETYPTLEDEHLDEFMPKKDTYRVVKCHERLELLVNAAGTLLFFKQRDGPWIPTLRLLQQYPYMLVPQRVDKVRYESSNKNQIELSKKYGDTVSNPSLSVPLYLISGSYKVCIVWCKQN